MFSWQEGGEQLVCLGRQMEAGISPGHGRPEMGRTWAGGLGEAVAKLLSVHGGHMDSLNPEQLCLQLAAFSSRCQQKKLDGVHMNFEL